MVLDPGAKRALHLGDMHHAQWPDLAGGDGGARFAHHRVAGIPSGRAASAAIIEGTSA
jgi:hypothetical protein